MKLSSILIPATALLLLAGCNSLDNPISNLFRGVGHDQRVYNTQTGQWEWPEEKRQPAEKKSAAVASAMGGATPAPHSYNDTRYWDASRNQWVEADQPRTSTPAKPKPTPASSAPAPATTQAAPPPPPPRPSRATGVYNPSTGKIDWQTSEADAPHGAVAPPPKKHWYWPF